MQICVCGWYYTADLCEVLFDISDRYDVHIIGHKEVPVSLCKSKNYRPIIRWCEIPNIGLEFGAYNHFLWNGWDKRSGVLFMHDDVDITDVSIFGKIANCGHDQAFIFRDEADGKANQNFHGRMLYCSAKFLRHILSQKCECAQATDRLEIYHNHFCSSMCAEHHKESNGWGNEVRRATYGPTAQHKRCVNCGSIIKGDTFYATVLVGTGPHTGFWFDPWNYGHSSGPVPIGVRHYNDGIYHFQAQCKHAASLDGLDSDRKLYFPSINLHKRGVPK